MFSETMEIVQKVLANSGSIINVHSYDGVIVKQLKASNTLDPNRDNTNQTHIAITGDQRNLFPCIMAPNFADWDGTQKDKGLKKYLALQIPATLHHENVNYLASDADPKVEGDEKVYVSVIPRGTQDQLQLSLTEYDSPSFITFRKHLPTNSFLIVLKKKEEFQYDIYGVLESDSSVDGADLSSINNAFDYLKGTLSVVKLDDTQHKDKAIDQVGRNILLYGVPGAGKSYTVEHEYTKGSEKVERVVFHPDYTYSDFVGQILPKVHKDKTATYEFVPGPFTRILKEAQNDQDAHYWLVIEEINRGNAPAIFGDLFQLLDRKEDGSSEYAITNADIAEQVYNNREHKVTLPGNLSIIATMNTSDQNVFTLDTAFQRRWQMRMIDNDFDTCTDTELMDMAVLDTGVKWKDFAKVINKSIVEANASNMISTADKQLGTHFVSKHELQSKSEVFAEKVLKYLWDDAVKMNPDKVFSSEYKELRLVIKDFNNETGSNKLNVFNKRIRTALQEIVDGLSSSESSGDAVGPQDGSDDN